MLIRMSRAWHLMNQPPIVWKRFKKQRSSHLFVWIGLLFLLGFSYTPMFGILMAFKDYSIVTGIRGIFTSEWADFVTL